MKKTIILLLIAIAIMSGLVYLRGSSESTGILSGTEQAVISLGQDLTDEEEEKVMAIFEEAAELKDARIVTVSNREERKYLEGLVDERLIGSRALSSAYCELLKEGNGIRIKTHNISYVSPFMYANALSTAGIEDARLIIAAPFEVSGTAALTGIIKAFELAKGSKLSGSAKETAHQEVAETSRLGQKLGQDKAEALIYEVKRQVIEKDSSDSEEIRRIIIEVSSDLNVKLSSDDIKRITELMKNLNRLDLSISKVNKQVEQLQKGFDNVKKNVEESRSIISQIISLINDFINSLRALLS